MTLGRKRGSLGGEEEKTGEEREDQVVKQWWEEEERWEKEEREGEITVEARTFFLARLRFNTSE